MKFLFAYGTLICEDIMEAVSGCRLVSSPGVLPGFGRFCVRNEDYPALTLQPGGRVVGQVYHDVPEPAWKRLDRFEGEMYRRQQVDVQMDAGDVIQAITYVMRPESRDLLESREWSFEVFLQEGKSRFIRSYVGYDAL